MCLHKCKNKETQKKLKGFSINVIRNSMKNNFLKNLIQIYYMAAIKTR